MDEKSKNLAIYAEIKKTAVEVFSQLTLNIAGTYTAAELWNGKDVFGDKITINYNGTENRAHTITVEAATYKISSSMIFYALMQYEKLCGVTRNDRAQFKYGEDAGNEIVSEKAVYYSGRMERDGYFRIVGDGSYKIITRKHTMRKVSPEGAIDKQGRIFYKFGDIWYLISDNDNGKHRLNKNDIKEGLSKFNFELNGEFVPIYRMLFDAMTEAGEFREEEHNEDKAVPATWRNGKATKNINGHQETREYDAPKKPLITKHGKAHVASVALASSRAPLCVRRKISLFKAVFPTQPINHRTKRQNTTRKKKSGNTSVYRAFIRGETKNNILVCR